MGLVLQKEQKLAHVLGWVRSGLFDRRPGSAPHRTFSRRSVEWLDVDVFIASEDATVFLLFGHDGPYAMPRLVFGEFEGNGDVILVPVLLPTLAILFLPLESLVGHGNQGTVDDGQFHGQLAVGRLDDGI